ncbi:MAG: YihY family inner membrane protein [Nitrospirales bacterium]|nr:YihY family inner membrane protein [Nitrospirales bacterium]
MRIIAQIEKFFRRDLWAATTPSLQGAAGFGIRVLRLLVVAIADFQHGVLSVRATSLVYTTLLSLVPFLAVMFSVLKAFGVHEAIEPLLAQGLEPLGSKGIEITDRVMEFVGNLKVGVLGAVGVAGLFYTTYSLIDKIEESLNAIWRVRQCRPLTRKFSDYLSVVLVGPVLVFAAFALTASAQSHWLVQRVLHIEPVGQMMLLLTQLMPFVFLCFAFTFLFKFVPHTQVRLISALTGGVTAGILWQLAGIAFASFVAESARYSAIYSSFAILILFLIWLYVGWLIVLIGAQVAYYHQHPTAYLHRINVKQHTHAFREHTALSILVEIAKRYYAGEAPYQLADLATMLQLPQSLVDDLVTHWVAHGIIYRTDEPKGIALGRPPEHITLIEVLELLRYEQMPTLQEQESPDDTIGKMLQHRDEAVRTAIAGITLKSFAMQDKGSAWQAPRPHVPLTQSVS